MIAARLQRASVKIMQREIGAQPRDIIFRLVVSGKHIHAVCSSRENRAHTLQSASPIDQISRSEVQIRVHLHEFLEGRRVGVYVGEDQEFHGGWAPTTQWISNISP